MSLKDKGASSLRADRATHEPSPSVSAVPVGIPSAWQWYAGNNDEFFQCGPFSSREEAIEEGLGYWDCGPVHIIEAQKGKWPAPNATSVIDDMFNNADELFYEDYPEPVGTKEETAAAEAELQAALDAWMDRWRGVIFPAPTTFSTSRNREVVDAAQAIEARRAETGTGSVVDESAVAESDAPHDASNTDTPEGQKP